MLDLHLFLGRKPLNVYSPPSGGDGDGNGTRIVEGVGKGEEAEAGAGGGGEGEGKAVVGYDMSELTPDRVHYGNFPQQVGVPSHAFWRSGWGGDGEREGAGGERWGWERRERGGGVTTTMLSIGRYW